MVALNKALKKPDTEAQQFFKDTALETIKSNMATIDVNSCHQQLQQQDTLNHSMTEADPSLSEMVQRHAFEIQKMKNKEQLR